MVPNLFKLATKELSQDAFLAWLIQWGEPELAKENPELNRLAQTFIRRLCDRGDDFEISHVEAGRQWGNIDVWAEINDDICLVIEDKKGTREHSDQLNRYKTFAQDELPNKEIVCVYVKFEEQSDLSAVEKAGYRLFDREMMLSVFEQAYMLQPQAEQDSIVRDFYRYLKDLDESIKAYQTTPVEEWGKDWYIWQGFFSSLQKALGTGAWDYVANPSGGFQGYWWHWKRYESEDFTFRYYLQLEYDRMIFKQGVLSDDNSVRREARSFYRKAIAEQAKASGQDIIRYGRLGSYMGVARLNSDYRVLDEDGLLDFDATVMRLRQFQEMLNCLEGEFAVETE